MAPFSRHYKEKNAAPLGEWIMTGDHLVALLGNLRRLAAVRENDALSDSLLLERYKRDRDESAFAALLRRHGDMIWNVCNRVLADEADADDAFQATFLVLLHKAAQLRGRASLAGWLQGVAWRLARKVKSEAARRRDKEVRAEATRTVDTMAEVERRDLRALLDEELQRLPEKYRAPVVLCYLEGKTYAEAARHLDWREGTVCGRLARARELLRQRLSRRGVTLSGAALLAAMTETSNAPGATVSAVAKMAALFALGQTAGKGAVSLPVAALAQSALQAMSLAKLKMTVIVLLALSVCAAGAGWTGHRFREAEPSQTPTSARVPLEKPKSEKVVRTDLYGDPLPAGALARLGTVRLRQRFASAVFSEDGKFLISVGDDETVRYWQPSTGKEVRRISLSVPQLSGMGFVLAADGKSAAGWVGETVGVWDAATGKERSHIRTGKVNVDQFVLSANGKTLVTALNDYKTNRIAVCLWDMATGKELHRWQQQHLPNTLAFSPDGKHLAIGDNLSLQLRDAATSKELHTIPGDFAGALAFSADSAKIAGANRHGAVKVWNAADGRQVLTLKEPAGHPLYSLAFSPDGKTLVGGTRKNLVFWDVGNRKLLRKMPGVYTGVTFALDGKTLAASGASAIHVWDAATGKELASRPAHSGEIECVAATADGKVLASISNRDGEIRLWDPSSGKPLFALLGNERDEPFGVFSNQQVGVFSADSKLFLSGGWGAVIRSWNVSTGRQSRQFTIEPAARGMAENRQVSALAVSPEGDRLAALCMGGDLGAGSQVNVWDMATGKSLARRRVDGRGFAAKFAPDGRSLAVGTEEGIVVQDTHTGRTLLTIRGKVRAPFAFSPDGRVLAYASFKPKPFPPNVGAPAGGDPHDTDAVCLMELATGKSFLRIETGPLGHDLLAFAPDGRTIATADRERFHIWDAVTGKHLFLRALPEKSPRFLDHSFISSLTFLPGGRLATGMRDSTILIWDLEPKSWHGGIRGKDLKGRDLERFWADLAADNAARAHRALWTLAATPAKTVPFLKDHLRPVAAVDGKEVQHLIDDLDSEQFATREAASQKLASLGAQAESALRRALEGKPSLEVCRRLERLLADAELAQRNLVHSADVLRTLRAIRVLDAIGTTEAWKLLQKLAEGAAEARETREAKAALRRLAVRRSLPN
jgi:RNA polymerase sigma factor (sigma-70 family)